MLGENQVDLGGKLFYKAARRPATCDATRATVVRVAHLAKVRDRPAGDQ